MIGFYSQHGARKETTAVLDTKSTFSIVANRLIETSNPITRCLPTTIEDSLGKSYTQIGTVILTWFRPSRPATFDVTFAVVQEDVVQEDISVVILGKQACDDSQLRRELELLPFGLAPAAAMTEEQKEELRKKREEQARAQAASEQEKRNRDQQAAHGGPRQSQL
jgi:hypothetical protein